MSKRTKKITKQQLPIYVKQYKDWLKTEQSLPPKQVISTTVLLREIKNELKRAKSISAAEYALERKWKEVKDLVKNRSREELDEVYRLIFVPKGISDFRRLEPELIWIKDTTTFETIDFWGETRTHEEEIPDRLNDHWEILRTLVSSQTNDGTIGRSLRFLVRDKISQKYLGVICVSGEMLALSPRNEAIWGKTSTTFETTDFWGVKKKREIELPKDLDAESGKAQNVWTEVEGHSANGSTIIPVQNFGNTFLGGKLLALLCLSKPVADLWKKQYDNVLVSMTTTSLWKSQKENSQYDGLKPYWENVGETTGATSLKISEELYAKMRDWMWVHYPQDYHFHFKAKDAKGQIAQRDNKTRAMEFCYKKLGLKKEEFESGHTRGIYFARLYKNTDAFLRGEITEDKLEPAFDNSIEALTDFWKYGRRGDTSSKSSEGKKGMAKHYLDKKMRDKEVKQLARPEWYRAAAFMTFKQVKNRWGKEVGR